MPYNPTPVNQPLTARERQLEANRSIPINTNKSTTGFDPKEFDRINLDASIQGGYKGLQEARAWDQGNMELAGKFAVNTVGTFLFETLKMPGYLYELGSLSDGINNAYLDGVKKIQEATQGELGKVYTPPSLDESKDVIDHFNKFFVAGDVANGVGFLASFLMPGQILKLLGAGKALATGVGKLGKVADTVIDGGKFLEAGQANMFGRLLLKSGGRTGRGLDFSRGAMDFTKFAANADSALAVGINSYLESAAEASELFDNLTRQGMSKEKAGQLSMKAFHANMPLLLASNYIVERYLFNGFGRMTRTPTFSKALDMAFNEGAKQTTKLGRASSLVGAVAKGFAQEGLFEEGMQSVIQKGAEQGDTSIGNLLKIYGESFEKMRQGDTDAIDFTKSVVLGGILGSPMGVIGNVQDARRERDFLMGRAKSSPSKVRKFFGAQEQEAIPGAVEFLRNNATALKKNINSLKTADGKIDYAKLEDAAAVEILGTYYGDLIDASGGDVNKANEAFIEGLTESMGEDKAFEALKIVGINPSLNAETATKVLRQRRDRAYFNKFLALEGGEQMLDAHIEDMMEMTSVRYEQNTGVKMSSEVKANLLKEVKQSAEQAKSDKMSSQRITTKLNALGEYDHDFLMQAEAARTELLGLTKLLEQEIQSLEAEAVDQNHQDSIIEDDLNVKIDQLKEDLSVITDEEGKSKLQKEIQDLSQELAATSRNYLTNNLELKSLKKILADKNEALINMSTVKGMNVIKAERAEAQQALEEGKDITEKELPENPVEEFKDKGYRKGEQALAKAEDELFVLTPHQGIGIDVTTDSGVTRTYRSMEDIQRIFPDLAIIDKSSVGDVMQSFEIEKITAATDKVKAVTDVVDSRLQKLSNNAGNLVTYKELHGRNLNDALQAADYYNKGVDALNNEELPKLLSLLDDPSLDQELTNAVNSRIELIRGLVKYDDSVLQEIEEIHSTAKYFVGKELPWAITKNHSNKAGKRVRFTGPLEIKDVQRLIDHYDGDVAILNSLRNDHESFDGVLNNRNTNSGKHLFMSTPTRRQIKNGLTKVSEQQESRIAELEGQLSQLNQSAPKRDKLSISNLTENSVTINNLDYTYTTNELGNVNGLSPVDNSNAVIEQENVFIEVDIARSKLAFDALNESAQILSTLPEVYRNTLDNIWGLNMTDIVASGIEKLYSNQLLNDSELLQTSLWLKDVFGRITNLIEPANSQEVNDLIIQAYNTAEILESLLNKSNDYDLNNNGQRSKSITDIEQVESNVDTTKSTSEVRSADKRRITRQGLEAARQRQLDQQRIANLKEQISLGKALWAFSNKDYNFIKKNGLPEPLNSESTTTDVRSLQDALSDRLSTITPVEQIEVEVIETDDQIIPPTDMGDVSITEDMFANGLLSTELFGTTGDLVTFDSDGNDVYTTVGDIQIPQLTSSEGQLRWGLWIDKQTTADNLNVIAGPAYYDERDGDMKDALIRENPRNQDSGKDIYVRVVDNNNNTLYVDKNGDLTTDKVDGYPLIRFVRRPETKFPANGIPKMNAPSIINYYLNHLGLPAIDSKLMASDKTLNGSKPANLRIMSTATGRSIEDVKKMTVTQFVNTINDKAIQWASETYTKQIEYLRDNPTKLSVYGITRGHELVIKDLDGQVKSYSFEDMGLSKSPRNFNIYKSNSQGEIVIGTTKMTGYIPGVVYIEKDGSYYPAFTDKLNSDQVDTVMFFIAQMGTKSGLNLSIGSKGNATTIAADMSGVEAVEINGEVFEGTLPLLPKKGQRYSVLTSIMNWGKALNGSKHDIFIEKGTLFFGDKQLSLKAIRDAYEADDQTLLAPLKMYLENKLNHINYQLLTEAMGDSNFKYPKVSVTDGKVKVAMVNYLDEVLDRLETTEIPVNVREQHRLPRRLQRNLQIELPVPPTKAQTPKKEVTERAPFPTELPPKLAAQSPFAETEGPTEKVATKKQAMEFVKYLDENDDKGQLVVTQLLIERRLGFSKDVANNLIKRLVDAGFLRQKGKAKEGQQVRYELTNPRVKISQAISKTDPVEAKPKPEKKDPPTERPIMKVVDAINAKADIGFISSLMGSISSQIPMTDPEIREWSKANAAKIESFEKEFITSDHLESIAQDLTRLIVTKLLIFEELNTSQPVIKSELPAIELNDSSTNEEDLSRRLEASREQSTEVKASVSKTEGQQQSVQVAEPLVDTQDNPTSEKTVEPEAVKSKPGVPIFKSSGSINFKPDADMRLSDKLEYFINTNQIRKVDC